MVHWRKYFRRILLVSNPYPGFSSVGVHNCLKLAILTLKRKQFFTPIEGNPEDVLLSSRICLKYVLSVLSHEKLTFQTQMPSRLENSMWNILSVVQIKKEVVCVGKNSQESKTHW